MKRHVIKAAMAGAALVLGLGAVLPALAQTTSPAPGSAERRALLDALRPVIARDLGAPLEFKVNGITVAGDRAFVLVEAMRPGGREIDMDRTPMGRRVPADFRDGPRAEALLQRRNGRWRVIVHGTATTDVWWADSSLCPAWRSVLPAAMCQ